MGRLFLALATAVILGLPTSVQTHPADQQVARGAATGDPKQKPAASATSLTSNSKNQERAPSSSAIAFELTHKARDEENRAKADLRAQQEMARWALGMLIVSAVGTLLSFIGVFLIWQTLIHTARGADADDRAAAEARRSADAAVAVQRPWLKVDFGPATAIEQRAGSQVAFRLSLIIKNVGNTPASHVWPVCAAIATDGYFSSAEELACEKRDQLLMDFHSDRIPEVIFPGDEHIHPLWVGVQIKEVKANAEGRFKITVYGGVSYKWGTERGATRFTGMTHVRDGDGPMFLLPDLLEGNVQGVRCYRMAVTLD